MRWNEKRYYSLDYYLKTSYGEKLYKIALNGGCTCPNRDGTLGAQGCIFCSAGGSGDFASDSALPIKEQIAAGIELIKKKQTGSGYIAYFQAYTNTYAPLPRLRAMFTEAIEAPEIRILSIATRPDCLDREVLDLLDTLNRQKPVWVELGLQTIHARTARFIRRGYELPVFEEAVKALHLRDIPVIAHVILGLPGETHEDMLKTVRYLNQLPISGIKLQLLHILQHTDLEAYYREHPFPVMDMDSYFALLGDCLCALRPDIVIHRLTGDGPKSILIAPLWTANKRKVLNAMQKYFKDYDIWQGKYYSPDERRDISCQKHLHSTN